MPNEFNELKTFNSRNEFRQIEFKFYLIDELTGINKQGELSKLRNQLANKPINN